MSPVQLPLRLLGSFQVGEATSINLRRKNRAILAYLALSPRALTRHELANIFCRSAADPAHTLRLSLSRLRRNLGQAALNYAGESVQFNQDYFQTDFHPFQKQLAQTELHDISLAGLEKVVSLYRGEFLEGLHLPDAPEFEMWLVGQRSYWRQLYERGALAWCKRLLSAGQYAAALPVAQQLVQQNSLLEEAHYHLIWLYAQTDQRAAALAQYNQCRNILQRDLAVEPTPALQTLYEDILSGRLTQPHEIQPAALSFAISSTAVDFVGRESELVRVQQVWAEVVTGHGRSLLITSPAGGGKTRLVQEIAPILPAALLLHGNCYESARALSYQPWIQLLEGFLTQNGEKSFQQLAPHWQAELGRLLPHLAARQKSSMSEGNREQLFAAVVALLQQAKRPLLLFLDDLQWADEASLQLFHFVLERMKNDPLLLLGAYRTEEAEDNPALLTLAADLSRHSDNLTLTLEPLSATAVNSLIAQLWPQLPTGYRTPHLQDSIGQATGGNPLFAIEIIRELAGLTHIPDELPVPPSLRDLIARRLRQLPASSRQVLESLAILDQPTYFDLAQQISGRSENETLQALEQGLRWRFLQTEANHQIDFSHDLIRQGIRERLSSVRQHLLHRRVASLLATRAALETIDKKQTMASHILHHALMGEHHLLVFEWALYAAQHAEQLYAFADALKAYEAISIAFAKLQSDPEFDVETAEAKLIEPLLIRTKYSTLVGYSLADKTSLLEEAQRLLQRHPDPRLQAMYNHRLALYLEEIGEHQQVVATFAEAIKAFRSLSDDKMAALCLHDLGRFYISNGKNTKGYETLTQALAYFEAEDDLPGQCLCLQSLAWTGINLGKSEQARQYAQRAAALAQQQGDLVASATANLALAAVWNFYKDAGKIEKHARLSRQLFQQIGYEAQANRSYFYIGIARHIDLDFDAALEIYEEVLPRTQAANDMWLVGWVIQLIGIASLQKGDLAAADHWLTLACEQRSSGMLQNHIYDLNWMGRLKLMQGDLPSALDYTTQSVNLIQQSTEEFFVWDEWDVYICRGEVLQVAGRAEEASVMITRAYESLMQFCDQITDPTIRADCLGAYGNVRIVTAYETGTFLPLTPNS